jgi:hypothetical protein
MDQVHIQSHRVAMVEEVTEQLNFLEYLDKMVLAIQEVVVVVDMADQLLQVAQE